MLYVRFPRALKELVRWLTLACAVGFLGALTWKSGVMGLSSLRTLEKATGVFRLPLYPLKLFISLGALLFLVAALALYLRREK
jgi:TRAP-type C4-dicarboxylate transport system permease small subunit